MAAKSMKLPVMAYCTARLSGSSAARTLAAMAGSSAIISALKWRLTGPKSFIGPKSASWAWLMAKSFSGLLSSG